jgi:type VI secretion system protein ImpG
MQIYSVDSVIGIEERTGKRWVYEPFFSFSREGSDRRSYTTTSRIAPTDRNETYVSVTGHVNQALQLPVETLSLELTCTNAGLPRDRLKEGMITLPSPGIPSVTDLTNLTQPTLDVPPPVHEHPDFLWQFLSHLSYNRMSVATPEALRGVLSLYDWSKTEASRRRLAGLKNVTWNSREMLRRGSIIRGAEVRLEIEEGHFEDEGDLCLFGLVLSEFFSLYATINSFIDVTILLTPSGRRYEWKSKKGQLPPV